MTHVCALAAVGFAARAAAVTHGWLRVPPVERVDDAPLVSILVPARDEERTIERCVRSLLAQTLPHFEVIVVDDRSSDRTGAILDALAAEDPRVVVVHGEPLPDGWVGKPWALAQGVRRASGTWLLFTDADTWHAPHAATSALAFARARGADALSLATYQELESFAEQAILPTMLGLVLVASGSMAALNDPTDRDHALANGQYLLVSREAYDALGGHVALRNEIVEDLAFAQRLKADGRFRLVLAGGEHLVRVRMYTSLREIWQGFTKNLFLGAGGDVGALAAGTSALLLLSVVPGVLALDALARGRPWRALEATLALAVGVAIQDYGVRQVRLPRRLAWFAPIGYAACAAIALNSTARVLGGSGVVWRGRRYSGRSPKA
jgi:chlorobactene glucosyltransferase